MKQNYLNGIINDEKSLLVSRSAPQKDSGEILNELRLYTIGLRKQI